MVAQRVRACIYVTLFGRCPHCKYVRLTKNEAKSNSLNAIWNEVRSTIAFFLLLLLFLLVRPTLCLLSKRTITLLSAATYIFCLYVLVGVAVEAATQCLPASEALTSYLCCSWYLLLFISFIQISTYLNISPVLSLKTLCMFVSVSLDVYLSFSLSTQ